VVFNTLAGTDALVVEPVEARADFVPLLDEVVVVLGVELDELLDEAATTLTVVLPVIVPSDEVTVSVSDSTVLSVTWNVAMPLVNVILDGTATLVSDEVTVAVPV
jgi:hypothetical protein